MIVMENLFHDWNEKLRIAKEKVTCSSKPVSKLLPDGSHFFGVINVITGEPIKGVQTTSNGEVYEGFFEPGVIRSGECIVEDKSDDRKFIGLYKNGLPFRGTLVTRGFTFDGEFKDGMFASGKLVHVDGLTYEGEFEHDIEHHEGIYRQYHGVGKLVYPDGSIYTGDFVHGKRHGIGSYTRPDGYSYSGVYSQGEKSGEGREEFQSGETYIGQFHNGLRHGHGVLNSAFGETVLEGPFRVNKPIDGKWEISYLKSNKLKKYTGITKNLLPNGDGTMIYANGDCYNGEFKEGKRHGQGICVFADGDSYEGTWLRDIPQGLQLFEQDLHQHSLDIHYDSGPDCNVPGSACETTNASLIEVNFRTEICRDFDISESQTEDLPDLQSSFAQSFQSCFRKLESPTADFGKSKPDIKSFPFKIYDNGDKFIGYIDKYGNRQGFGRYIEHCSSSTYEGMWKDNLRHGQGILICGNAKYFGDFVNDHQEGEGTLILDDTSSYRGGFDNGLYAGYGILCSSDGTTYNGSWLNGEKCGSGELHYPDGTVYVGEFLGDKRHGKGILYQNEEQNKVIYDGWWKFDFRDGEGIYYICRHEFSTENERAYYEGNFVRNEFHGYGILFCPDGAVVEGQWLRGIAVSGQWKIKWGDGSSFTGKAIFEDKHKEFKTSNMNNFTQLKLPLPNGYGTMTYKDGSIYSGYFVKGLREGHGSCSFSNGERWEGSWVNDAVDMNGGGKGKLTLADGTVHEF